MTPRKPENCCDFFWLAGGEGVLGESDKGAFEQNVNASLHKVIYLYQIKRVIQHKSL